MRYLNLGDSSAMAAALQRTGATLARAEATGAAPAAPPPAPMTLDQAISLALARERITEAAAGAITVEPWAAIPASGQPFTNMTTAAVVLPAIAAEATVVSFTVPPGRNGIIQQVANQFVGGGWTEGTGDLVWRIEIDGVATQGFNNILGSLGAISRPGDFTGRPIRVREGQTVALICRNVAVAVAGQPLLGLLAGYFYPLSQEPEGTWL